MTIANLGKDTGGGKKVYAPPVLKDHGSVAKLTQNGQGSGVDGGSAGMRMMCV